MIYVIDRIERATPYKESGIGVRNTPPTKRFTLFVSVSEILRYKE